MSMSYGETSIEDQIAEVYEIPAEPKRYCAYTGCTQPLAKLNKGDMCFRHEQITRERKRRTDGGEFSSAGIERGTIIRRTCSVGSCPNPVTLNSLSGKCRVHDRPWTVKPKPDAPTPAMLVDPQPQAEICVDVVESDESWEASAALMQEEERERTQMTEEVKWQQGVCAVVGCEKKLQRDNKSGRCSNHAYLSKASKLKPGYVMPSNVGAAPVVEMEVTSDEQREVADIEMVAVSFARIVTLNVPVEAVDRFLLRLPLEDKTRIVEREIFGA